MISAQSSARKKNKRTNLGEQLHLHSEPQVLINFAHSHLNQIITPQHQWCLDSLVITTPLQREALTWITNTDQCLAHLLLTTRMPHQAHSIKHQTITRKTHEFSDKHQCEWNPRINVMSWIAEIRSIISAEKNCLYARDSAGLLSMEQIMIGL